MTARPVNRASLGMGGQLGMGESIMLQEKARYEECKLDVIVSESIQLTNSMRTTISSASTCKTE